MLLARILKQFLGVLVAILGGWLAGILFAFAWAAVDVTTHHGEVPAIALFVLPWIVALGSAAFIYPVLLAWSRCISSSRVLRRYGAGPSAQVWAHCLACALFSDSFRGLTSIRPRANCRGTFSEPSSVQVRALSVQPRANISGH